MFPYTKTSSFKKTTKMSPHAGSASSAASPARRAKRASKHKKKNMRKATELSSQVDEALEEDYRRSMY